MKGIGPRLLNNLDLLKYKGSLFLVDKEKADSIFIFATEKS